MFSRSYRLTHQRTVGAQYCQLFSDPKMRVPLTMMGCWVVLVNGSQMEIPFPLPIPSLMCVGVSFRVDSQNSLKPPLA